MNLNARQAGDKLGIGLKTVYALVRQNILHDLKERNPNAKKHYGSYPNKEVVALKKAGYKPRLGPTKMGPILERYRASLQHDDSHESRPKTARPKRNLTPLARVQGHRAETGMVFDDATMRAHGFTPAGDPLFQRPVAAFVPTPGVSFREQLDRIEAKVDRLIKMWA